MTPPANTVAVTGATGFIGRRLCSRLTAAGFAVRALTRSIRSAESGVEWVTGHLADPVSLERLVADSAAVVHCAGAVRGATAADFRAPNIDGVANLLAAIGAVNRSIRLLHVSSIAARHPELSHYAASKQVGEQLVMAAGLRAAVIRPPAVYGPGDRELMPLLAGLHGGLGVIPGHRGRFSLICVDDLITAIEAWLGSPGADGDCFEVHDGKAGGYDWDEVIRVVEEIRGRRLVALRLPKSLLGAVAGASTVGHRFVGRAPMLTPGKVRELYFADWTCSNERFSARTGWTPHIDLAAGLRLTFAAGRPVRAVA